MSFALMELLVGSSLKFKPIPTRYCYIAMNSELKQAMNELEKVP